VIVVAAIIGGSYYYATTLLQNKVKPTPTATPSITPKITPNPTPTQTPTSTPTSAPVDWKLVNLVQAVYQELVDLTTSGDGIEKIDVTLKSKSNDPLEVTIEPGTMFQAQSSNVQSMVVTEEKIVYLESPDDIVSDTIDVACAAMDLSAPKETDAFSVSNAPTQENLVKLLNLPAFAIETFRTKQFAIWTITNNPPRDEYVGLGYFGVGSGPNDEEMSRVKTLFENAGVPTSSYQALTLVEPAHTYSPSPIPTPTPTPMPQLQILSSSVYTDVSGYYHIVGEVKNTLSVRIEYVKITATYYDSEKAALGTDFTFSETDVMEPNQKSPFDLSSYPVKITPSSYKLSEEYQMTLRQPPQGLAILNHTPSTTSGDYKIVGEVKNNGATQATYVKVVCTFYNSSGLVIGMGTTYTNPNTISAGGTAPFELHSYRKLTPAYYELQVQGMN
jgi:hypothetical protein